MTNKAWTEEISRAVAASGLPWRVASAWVEQSRSVGGADLRDTRSGAECQITIALDRFPAPADRRAEAIRQLEARTKR